jgi:signal transduction histidine kinase
MPITDSYDALRRSIERALQTDLPRGPIAELADSIDRELLEQARKGELTLGYLRLLAVAGYVVVAIQAIVSPGSAASPAVPIGEALLGGVWAAGAIALVLALRRGWYRLWLRHIVPAADALMIWATFLLTWGRAGDAWAQTSVAALSYVTALCAFLAVSGALRLSRSSAQLSAVLAVAIFVFAAAAADLDVVHGVAIAATLLVAGALSATAPARIRRIVTDQVGRMALSRMYDDARREINAREEVLKIVSHDLRNPLNTISMSAGLMLEVDLPAEQRAKQLSLIKRAGERMNRLIQDLLDVAKLDAGRLGIDPRPTEIAPLIAEAEEMLRPIASDKSIRLDVVTAGQLPRITADAGRVLQVLSNLVGNAVKFTPPEGRVTIRVEPFAGSVRFCVSDTGSGIPPEQLPHIFGRFWQADRSDRRGIGLGLAIAKGIVEAHGGRISVESRVGEGTSFYFTLGGDGAASARQLEERRTSGDRRRDGTYSGTTSRA